MEALDTVCVHGWLSDKYHGSVMKKCHSRGGPAGEIDVQLAASQARDEPILTRVQ